MSKTKLDKKSRIFLKELVEKHQGNWARKDLGYRYPEQFLSKLVSKKFIELTDTHVILINGEIDLDPKPKKIKNASYSGAPTGSKFPKPRGADFALDHIFQDELKKDAVDGKVKFNPEENEMGKEAPSKVAHALDVPPGVAIKNNGDGTAIIDMEAGVAEIPETAEETNPNDVDLGPLVTHETPKPKLEGTLRMPGTKPGGGSGPGFLGRNRSASDTGNRRRRFGAPSKI